MIQKSPECFSKNIFHHGKLSQVLKCENKINSNSFVIIDEIDTGDKQGQRLDKMLHDV